VIICGCVGGTDAEAVYCKSDVMTPNIHSSRKPSVLDDTAADECVFEMTFDEDDIAVQSKKCKFTREFLTILFVFSTAISYLQSHAYLWKKTSL